MPAGGGGAGERRARAGSARWRENRRGGSQWRAVLQKPAGCGAVWRNWKTRFLSWTGRCRRKETLLSITLLRGSRKNDSYADWWKRKGKTTTNNSQRRSCRGEKVTTHSTGSLVHHGVLIHSVSVRIALFNSILSFIYPQHVWCWDWALEKLVWRALC